MHLTSHTAVRFCVNSEFGLLFHLAAERTGTKITHHGFDNAVVQVHRDDMAKFMDYLNTAMLPDDEDDAAGRRERGGEAAGAGDD